MIAGSFAFFAADSHVSDEVIRTTYNSGQSAFNKKDYKKAVERYHKTCSLCLAKNNLTYYAPALFNSGRAFYELGKWSEACGPFEYVVTNGNLFNRADYNEALQKLFVSYNNSGQPSKTVTLFNKLSEKDFDSEVYLMLSYYYANACAALKKNNEAYNTYLRVIESSGKRFDGIDSFFLRFAIDEFNEKHYDQAQEYLSKIELSENNDNSDIRLLKNLYEAKILLEKHNPVEAEKKLSGLESLARKSEIKKTADSYYATLLQCKIQNEKWDDIPALYGKIKEPDDGSKIVRSTYYYKKGQFEKVEPLAGEMYASALCRLGKYPEACAEYEKLGLKNTDYAKALFNCGLYDKAYQTAKGSDDYICGLCCINTKQWKKAAEHFAAYIKGNSSKPDFISLSLYYKGYAEYCLGEFKNAYSSFVRFGMEKGGDAYKLKGTEYAVKSALQTGDFKNASAQAENLVRLSEEGEQKQKAVILSAEIFADYKNYDAAINLLAPYTSGRNDFASQTLFLTAGLYERKGNIEKADEFYRKVYETLPRSAYAEEAMYRAGEVYYSAEKYAEAYTRFNTYIYKYSSGNFSEPAMFYCGDSALRLGEIDRVIMLNKTLLGKYPSGVYSYGANKNLLTAYYAQENYNASLQIARDMVRNYPEQSAEDEIGKRLSELEKIVNGTDPRVAKKQTEYNKAGASKTKQGRALGSELVRLYAESLYTQDDAYKLASELFPLQTSDSERGDAAGNAEFIADYQRKHQKNSDAAKMYLKAAEYYRSIRNSDRAAVCLYSAAEAFSADGLTGDARETAALLRDLYPDSIQAEKVGRITGE